MSINRKMWRCWMLPSHKITTRTSFTSCCAEKRKSMRRYCMKSKHCFLIIIIINNFLTCSFRCDGEYKLIISQNGTPFPGFIKGEEPTGRVRYGYISAHHLNGDTIAYAEQSGEGKLLISCREERFQLPQYECHLS